MELQDCDGNWLIPNEVLLHIIKFLPAKDRQNISLTCSKLYELICSVEKNLFPLKITKDQLDDDEICKSMMNSKRHFNKLEIYTTRLTTLEQLYRLNGLCFKFGLSIVDLLWDSCKLTNAQIITLLNFMPNLKSLSAISWQLPLELFDEPTPELSLQCLHTLKVTNATSYNRDSEPTINFFTNFLPKNIIKDLNLKVEPANFLVNQQSVVKLHLDVSFLQPEDLLNIRLSELSLKMRSYRSGEGGRFVLQSVIEKQPNLIALDISDCTGCFDKNDAAFVAICNLKKLETLKLNIDDLSSSVFVEHFGKLEHLKELQIENYEHNFSSVVTIIDELCNFNMKKLKTLAVHLCDIGLPLDRIQRIGRRFINLKEFSVRCDHPLALDSYLENLKQLESLSIDYHYSREFSKLCNSFEIKSDTLKVLSLQGFAFGSDNVNSNEVSLLNLIEMVPNLEKLELDASFPFNIQLIIRVIEKLKRIKSITNMCMVQSGDSFNRFDSQAIERLKFIASLLEQFSIELRLNAATENTDIWTAKIELYNEYNVKINQNGSYNKKIINITKKFCKK